jgi:hypothetical protein
VHGTASFGSANGRPSGPITSIGSCGRRSASHRVPAPWAAKTISTVPPWTPVSRTRYTENARRSSIDDCSPPTASATK